MLLNNKVYNVLKFIALVLLPALGTLYFVLAQIWGLPDPEKVLGTISAVDTFLGAMLGISNKQYQSDPARFDGTLAIEDHEDGSSLRLTQVDPKALVEKDEIVFRIDR
jgi:hypothetical protein